MSKATWSDIRKGDAVELGGKLYAVTKAKAKGKKVAVRVERNGQKYEHEVKAKDPVIRARIEGARIVDPLHDRDGRQQRWAKKAEAKEVGGKLPKGDASVTAPPRPPMGDPWETPRDRVERKLDKLLGAQLVAETDDEAAGYYVPPVDVTTIAAHLAIFHGKDADEAARIRELGVDDMLEHHADEHAAALNGAALPVNHWHTATRPGVSD
jgi:hypothetical protein